MGRWSFSATEGSGSDSGRDLDRARCRDWQAEVGAAIPRLHQRHDLQPLLDRGSPVIDPATGNIYAQTTNGRLLGVSRDGKILWEHSMMERFGRLTFPNGRTGAAIVEGNLVIMHCITSYWGDAGQALDRFYAFDKLSGDLVWVSEPGVQPKDSSFSTPIVRDPQRAAGVLRRHRLWQHGLYQRGERQAAMAIPDELWWYQFQSGDLQRHDHLPAREGEPRYHRGRAHDRYPHPRLVRCG